MRCSFCGAWNQNGVSKKLQIERVYECLGELHENGYRYLSLSGGEPFLYDKLFDVIQYASHKGFFVNVTTNGLMINEEYIELIRNKNVITRISLHTLDAEKFRSLTGIDGLERIHRSVEYLKKSHAMFGIGMTVSNYNINEVNDLADYAYTNNASYIRYTPVYRVYKGTEFNTNKGTFTELLSMITRIVLDKYDRLEVKRNQTAFDEDMLNIFLTKPCGAGSEVYVALNPDLALIGCPVLPHYFEVPTETYLSYDDIKLLRKEYDGLLGSININGLEGKCATCLYRTSCRGGCLSTKLEGGLSLSAEQPICIYEIAREILERLSAEEKNKVLNYWNYWNLKISTGRKSKGCIRRLPIWEIHFRNKVGSFGYYSPIKS
jgi:radical SAM protein with 4Fe4S-binding SPASM domain